jgi:hypothetical protein
MKFLNICTDGPAMDRFRNDFLNQHSRFIHSSWLLKADIDRIVTLKGSDYTVAGLWDIVGSSWLIILKPVDKDRGMYIVDSKQVAHAMGYSRMRNLITGEEHTWDIRPTRELTSLGETEQFVPTDVAVDEDEEKEVEETDDDEEYVDPLVQALLDNMIDEGDTSAY